MRFDEYVENTRRTWNKKEVLEENLNHAFLGLTDESGEIAKAYKRNLAYGTELDKTNVAEEIGDLMYFTARVLDELQFKDSDKLYLEFNRTIKTPLKETPKASEIDVVLAIASRASNIFVAVSTSDGSIIVRALTDLLLAIKTLSVLIDIKLDSIMEANIEKLKKRYPEKFENEKALNRDIEAETKTVEENVRRT